MPRAAPAGDPEWAAQLIERHLEEQILRRSEGHHGALAFGRHLRITYWYSAQVLRAGIFHDQEPSDPSTPDAREVPSRLGGD
jgi:hypothetical protein